MRLSAASIDAAVGGAAVVVDVQRLLRVSFFVLRRRTSSPLFPYTTLFRSEEPVVVVRDEEIDRLARLVRRPRRNRRRPADNRLRARILQHRLIGTIGRAHG